MELEGRLLPDDPRYDDIMCDLADGIIDYEAYRDLLDRLNFRALHHRAGLPHATLEERIKWRKGICSISNRSG
jgi:hypothetical protein